MEFVFDTGDHDDLYQSTSSGTQFNYSGNSGSKFSNSAQRRSVVTGLADIEFTGPSKSAKKTKSIAPVKYVSRSTKAKKSRSKSFKWLKLSTVLYSAMVLRLLFMEGGVIDFYKMENVLETKKRDLVSLERENIELKKEIHLIKTSKSYQKQLARKHLGVIASNEYLVLFGKKE